MKHAYLVGKGKSLDNVNASWFGNGNDAIWCLNQSADVIKGLLPTREVHCVQNDPWINYIPPDGVIWHSNFSVPVGNRDTQRYSPEILTGVWNVPTCICALELMHREGINEIVMVGFDSHFDGCCREYASVLNAKVDDVTDFRYYDTMIKRYAQKRGIMLKWLDANGLIHDELFKFKKCILGVAKGAKYEKQTNGMIASFLKYNPDWESETFYGDKLEKYLPTECRCWSDFDKCEFGRWFAMKNLLDEYDTVLYADGDVRWYSEYKEHMNELVLCQHYVTGRCQARSRRQIFADGKANIGIIEVNRASQRHELFNYISGEVLKRTSSYIRHGTLWLQPLVSSCSDVGFDVLWNNDAGMDVAAWNLEKGDREVFKENGKYMVGTNTGVISPLISFHFSSKSLGKLVRYGNAVQQLYENYVKEGIAL